MLTQFQIKNCVLFLLNACLNIRVMENLSSSWTKQTSICTQFGRSKKGSRCSVVASGSRGANIHVIGSISTLGMLHHTIQRGSFTSEKAEYLRQTLRKANQYYQTTVVLVTDNAPCHSRAETILHEEEFIGNVLLRLAPYNPIVEFVIL